MKVYIRWLAHIVVNREVTTLWTTLQMLFIIGSLSGVYMIIAYEPTVDLFFASLEKLAIWLLYINNM